MMSLAVRRAVVSAPARAFARGPLAAHTPGAARLFGDGPRDCPECHRAVALVARQDNLPIAFPGAFERSDCTRARPRHDAPATTRGRNELSGDMVPLRGPPFGNLRRALTRLLAGATGADEGDARRPNGCGAFGDVGSDCHGLGFLSRKHGAKRCRVVLHLATFRGRETGSCDSASRFMRRMAFTRSRARLCAASTSAGSFWHRETSMLIP